MEQSALNPKLAGEVSVNRKKNKVNILATTTNTEGAWATLTAMGIMMIIPITFAIVWTLFPFIVWVKFNAVLRQLREMKVGIALIAVLTLGMVGCADPAFQQYIQNRQAAIATMPAGPGKFYEQARLDEAILADKRRQQEQAAQAALVMAAGLQGAANAYNASRPVNVNVWHWGRY